MTLLDITLTATKAAPSALALAAPWRGLLALAVCAAVAWAVGLGIALVDLWEMGRRGKSGG